MAFSTPSAATADDYTGATASVTVTGSTLAVNAKRLESVVLPGEQKPGTASAWREQTLTNCGDAELHFQNIGLTGKRRFLIRALKLTAERAW